MGSDRTSPLRLQQGRCSIRSATGAHFNIPHVSTSKTDVNQDATGSSRGASRSLLHQIKPEFQMPRACPVELHVWGYIAANVNLHGTRPWHPSAFIFALWLLPLNLRSRWQNRAWGASPRLAECTHDLSPRSGRQRCRPFHGLKSFFLFRS